MGIFLLAYGYFAMDIFFLAHEGLKVHGFARSSAAPW